MPYKSIAKRREYDRDRKRRVRAERRLRAPAPVPGPIPQGDPLNWIESRLKIPAGPRRGERFLLDPWQRDFLADAMGSGIQEAGLSVSRKNGKTAVVAALCLAYLVGPGARPGLAGDRDLPHRQPRG